MDVSSWLTSPETLDVVPELVSDMLLVGQVGYAGRSGLFLPAWTLEKGDLLDYYKAYTPRSAAGALANSSLDFVRFKEMDPKTLLGAENFQKNLDNMRGAEDARIADAKYEAEVEDAMRSGITLKPGQKSMGKEEEGFKLPFDLPKLPNPFGD